MGNQISSKILAEAILKRTYSRPQNDSRREDWGDICDRVIPFISEQGNFESTEVSLINDYTRSLITTPAGRVLWVGGTPWSQKNQNSPGLFNCASININSWTDFEQNFDLLMQGTGVGSVSTFPEIEQLPFIRNRINLLIIGSPGVNPVNERLENTWTAYDENDRELYITVGDSRQGWSSSLRFLLEAASSERPIRQVTIDLSHIRPEGAKINGFGGTANPTGLQRLFEQTVKITNKAVNRKLTPVEAEIILCEAGVTTVAGNIRRSARLGEFSAKDKEGAQAKTNLFQCDENGNWSIDPERDAFRMANFTRAFHSQPSKEEVLEAVRSQYETSEGAILNVREAVARSNADLLDSPDKKQNFLNEYKVSPDHAKEYLSELLGDNFHSKISRDLELDLRMSRFGLNPCLTGDTEVLTLHGNEPIKNLIDKTVTVWDGSKWVNTNSFQVTGYDIPVYTVTTVADRKITATWDHTFILADGSRKKLSELKVGDTLMQAGVTWHDELSTTLHEGEEIETEPKTYFMVSSIEFSHVADRVYCCYIPETHSFALSNNIMSGNCGEIVGANFFCNLSLVHLSQIDPDDWMTQVEAFQAATLQVVSLLHRKFVPKKFQESRQLDPIIAVNFTGGFNFFTKRFGTLWLHWWKHDRRQSFDSHDVPLRYDTKNEEKTLRDLYLALFPDESPDATLGQMMSSIERYYLNFWNDIVNQEVTRYCHKNDLRRPNRVTSLQPAGTKSLLTGEDAPGWHPPFASSYIRRVQFQRSHPLALAAIDIGLNVIPSVDAKDENGNLLDDIWDERVTDWLVEFPIIFSEAETFEKADFDPSQISALAQFDFAMQVQNFFVEHNSSSTIQFTEEEIEPLADRIYQAIKNDEGYISFALQQRFNGTGAMPRLPFEPRPLDEIHDKQQGLDYDKFKERSQFYFQQQDYQDSEGVTFFCTSGKCELT